MKAGSLNPHTGCSEQRAPGDHGSDREPSVQHSERTPKEGTCDRAHDRGPNEENVSRLDLQVNFRSRVFGVRFRSPACGCRFGSGPGRSWGWLFVSCVLLSPCPFSFLWGQSPEEARNRPKMRPTRKGTDPITGKDRRILKSAGLLYVRYPPWTSCRFLPVSSWTFGVLGLWFTASEATGSAHRDPFCCGRCARWVRRCGVISCALSRQRYFCQSRCGDALSLSVAADAIRIRLEAVISDHAAITKETCSDIGMGTLILC